MKVRSYMNAESATDFPEVLTAEMLSGFQTTSRGCTMPRFGMIGGRKYIAKCGGWSQHSSDGHVRNELVADAFLRAAGLAVPQSREYAVDFGDGKGARTIRLAAFAETAKPLMEVWARAGVRLKNSICEQAISAYPIQSLIAGIDTFTYDNVLVDGNGALLFVDNGASFDYRACGKPKGWFWERRDPDDPVTGYLSLVRHPDQYVLKEILFGIKASRLWGAIRRYDLVGLVASLPSDYRKPEFVEYAKMLMERIGKEED